MGRAILENSRDWFSTCAMAVQSNLDGTATIDDTRSQLFVTAGVFRRQMCGYGWQWGLVYDQLTDEFDEEFDAAQVRGEVSYLWRGHELGLWFTSEVSDGDSGEGAELSGLSRSTCPRFSIAVG